MPLPPYPLIIVAAGGTGADVARRFVKIQEKIFANRPNEINDTVVVLIDTKMDELRENAQFFINSAFVRRVEQIRLVYDQVLHALRHCDPARFPQNVKILKTIDGLVQTRQEADGTVIDAVCQGLKNECLRRLHNIEGAQQTPAFSRLALMSNWNGVRNTLRQIVDDVRNAERAGAERARIIVLGSCFGGTGSGVAVPILYATSIHGVDANRPKISLFLFDSSFSDDLANRDGARINSRLNAIRVLRELDLVQGLDTVGHPLFAGGNNDFNVENAAYDEAFLMTRSLFDVGNTVPFDDAKEKAARAIANRILLERVGGFAGLENSAFFLNVDDDNYRCRLSGKRRNYYSVGSASIACPQQECVDYVVESRLRKMLETLVGGGNVGRGNELGLNFDAYDALCDQKTLQIATNLNNEMGARLDPKTFTGGLPRTVRMLAQSQRNELVNSGREQLQAIDDFKTRAIEAAENASARSFADAESRLSAAETTLTALLKATKKTQGDWNKERDQYWSRISAAVTDRKDPMHIHARDPRRRENFVGICQLWAVCCLKGEIRTSAVDRIDDALKSLGDEKEKYAGLTAATKNALTDVERGEDSYRRNYEESVTGLWENLLKPKIDEFLSAEIGAETQRAIRELFPGRDLEGVLSSGEADDLNLIRGVIRDDVERAFPSVSVLLEEAMTNEALRPEVVRLIEDRFRESLPLFNVNSAGCGGMNPEIYSYVVVPDGNAENLIDQLRNHQPQALAVEWNNPNVIQGDVGSKNEIVFLQILTGIRPNFSTGFREAKRTYLEYGRNPGGFRLTLSVDQEEWFSDDERYTDADRNVESIRVPLSEEQL